MNLKINKKILLLGLIIILLGGIFSPIAAEQLDEDLLLEKQIGLNNNLDFDKKINILMNLGNMPSLSASVVKNDSVVWSKTYGYSDIRHRKKASGDTLYLVGSVSKTITATATMQLYERGYFDLDDDVSEYLPFDLKNPKYPNINITFRMLLSHQSSIGRDDILRTLFLFFLGYPCEWLDNFLMSDGKFYNFRNWLDKPPGEKFAYANTNFVILGYLIEKISNQSFEEYCKENIFEPLNMTNTGYRLSDFDMDKIAVPHVRIGRIYFLLPIYENRAHSAAGLRTTAVDLSHFLIAHMNGGLYEGIRILNESTVKLMQTIQYPNGKYGLGWRNVTYENGETYIGHGGNIHGARAEIKLRLSDNIGVIYIWNENFAIWETVESRTPRLMTMPLEKFSIFLIEKLLFEKA
ncbi:MAG: serine hydrolase, partial [Thermoplasmatales archaeon]